MRKRQKRNVLVFFVYLGPSTKIWVSQEIRFLPWRLRSKFALILWWLWLKSNLLRYLNQSCDGPKNPKTVVKKIYHSKDNHTSPQLQVRLFPWSSQSETAHLRMGVWFLIDDDSFWPLLQELGRPMDPELLFISVRLYLETEISSWLHIWFHLWRSEWETSISCRRYWLLKF